MGEMGFYPAGFYIWWMFLNGLLCFFEILFLQNLTGICKKMHAFACILANVVFTFLVMYLQSSEILRVLLHTGVIVCFSVFSMKLNVFETIVPAAVILTLYTFMEGIQSAFMGHLVQKNMSGQMGIAVQLMVSGVTAVLTAGSLWAISKRLGGMSREREASYRYALRNLCEAEKKNERYRAFQHDIDNHFLVLSGLVQEKRYAEAEKYSRNLSQLSDGQVVRVDTGNPAADILLKEKIGFAEANGIRVRCDVHFSREFFIEDADLCVLLANAMDNAIRACLEEEADHPEITVTAGMKRHFLFISVVNTQCISGHPGKGASDAGGRSPLREEEYGTGLKNIKRTVKKYEGAMETERSRGYFSLSMLLCLKPFAQGE